MHSKVRSNRAANFNGVRNEKQKNESTKMTNMTAEIVCRNVPTITWSAVIPITA